MNESPIKIMAFYLPQFHRVPENDRWWGEGFTEWVAVRNAEAYYKGHRQPKQPLHDNYYDLMEQRTMEWQSRLARKAGIHGFCFYHYWFGSGRQILEKPAENLLHWTDIRMPFCFSWANESWVKSWSKLENSWVWSAKTETKAEPGMVPDHGILLKQFYGLREEWKKHYQYLSPFFHDDRYIKIKNKPVFIIYRPELIHVMEQMARYWNDLAKQDGFDGVYLIGTNCQDEAVAQAMDAVLIQNPRYYSTGLMNVPKKYKPQCLRVFLESRKRKRGKRMLRSYDKMWRCLLRYRHRKGQKTYYGGCVSYDDTPRRGLGGKVYWNGSAVKFRRYLERLVQKSLAEKNELVFLNAWNEWGEGMYLEPDKENGYGYLRAVRQVADKI